MTAPLPTLLEYPFAAPPAPGQAIEVAPGGALAAHAAALRARSHQPVAAGRPAGPTLVDCGFGDAATRALWERHFATTLRGQRIRRIVATHCHPDHVGNAAWLSARFGAR